MQKNLEAITIIFTSRKKLNKLKINIFVWIYERTEVTRQTDMLKAWRNRQTQKVPARNACLN